ncbi:ribosomal protein L21e [Tritrichomonas foetus]|uniref:Ribosomal protein L21e n=1 Tax=Tritrichomonas foetus TaxID=1144522 RepID=A0A1J4KGN3_9EUKA|nr:ribosomal protein L21e [Tritrichomonas foetus]|eukprot:OHT10567.1 ribosomal protein L21e [Tritrichomonas foetus]
MGHTAGLRHATRYVFSRKYKKHGLPAPSQELRTFRLGDIVDIKVNGAVHKGMPHRLYHGTTGVVWNVSPHALGILVYRRVNNHIAPKRIYVRTEHVFHSNCKKDFLARVAQNQKLQAEAKAKNVKFTPLKRVPAQPKEAHICKPETIKAICFTPYRETC